MMSIISEADLNRSMSESLNAPLRSLLDDLLKQDANPELIRQIVSDIIELAQDVQRGLNSQPAQADSSFSAQRGLFLSLGQRILAFFNRYSEFLGEDGQRQTERVREVIEVLDYLLQGIQQIKDSEAKDGVEFLSELYEGLDKIVATVEIKGSLLPTSLQSVLKLFFERLPSQIEEKLNTTHSNFNQEVSGTIEPLRRMLSRTAMSGRFYLEFWAQEKQNNSTELTEEEILKKQIENNQLSLQAIRFLIHEDQRRVLTREQEEDNDFLMQVIDEYRERKLFA
jgi:hypothetical protein